MAAIVNWVNFKVKSDVDIHSSDYFPKGLWKFVQLFTTYFYKGRLHKGIHNIYCECDEIMYSDIFHGFIKMVSTLSLFII